MRLFILVGGVIVFLLGALWFLQGVGLVTMKPLLCFANCKPVVGPDLTWFMAGIVAMAIGLVAVWLGRRRK